MKKIIKLYLFFALSLIAVNASSQVNKDSLMAVWNTENLSDSVRLQALDLATWQGVLFANPDSGFYYAQMQYDYAQLVGNEKQMGNALNTQGVSYSMRGEYALALETYEKCLEIRQSINDLYGISKVYMNMGPAYSNQGDVVSALDVYEKSLVISESNNYTRLISVSLNNIGALYQNEQEWDKALQYFSQGLKLSKEIKDKRSEANHISNISLVYRGLNKWDSALVYANKGLELFEEIGDIKGVAGAFESLGTLYSEQNKYDTAISFELEALKIREKIKDKLGLASISIKLGNTYNSLGKPEQAEIWCNKGLNMADSIGSISLLRASCYCLYESATQQGFWKDALNYHELYTQYSDSLRANKGELRLQQLEFAKQTVRDSLDREIRHWEAAQVEEAKIDRRNSLQYTGIAIVLLSFVGWWFLASKMKLPNWLIDASLFIPFLMFFSFMENLTEPFADTYIGDSPIHKMLVSVALATIITPTHKIIEKLVRTRFFYNDKGEDQINKFD